MKDGQGVYVSESGEKFEVFQITGLVLIHTLWLYICSNLDNVCECMLSVCVRTCVCTCMFTQVTSMNKYLVL